MAESPLKIIEKLDPELFKNIEATQSLALSDGALPRKVKLLMAMGSNFVVDGSRVKCQVLCIDMEFRWLR